MHNLKIIFHVVIGHNIPFPFKMNLYIYIYMEIDLLTLYFLPLVGENSISNFEVLNDKNFVYKKRKKKKKKKEKKRMTRILTLDTWINSSTTYVST